MSNDLIYGLFLAVIILAAWVVYRRSFSRGYWDRKNDPIFFDGREDESQIIECASVANLCCLKFENKKNQLKVEAKNDDRI